MSDIRPEEMVLQTVEEAEAHARDFTNEQCVEYVRDYVALMGNFINVPEDLDPTDANVLAYTSLMASAMFQECFIKAYRFAEGHVNNVQKLNRLYES